MINKDMYNTFDYIDFTYYYPDHFSQHEDKSYLNSKLMPSFTWHYGDTKILSLEIKLTILIENDAILVNSTIIDQSIVGYEGQKAYNLINLISWTYTNNYWKKDTLFTTSDKADTEITLPIEAYKNTVKYNFIIYNLRGEEVISFNDLEISDDCSIYMNIDIETSKLIKSGIYKYVVKEINQFTNDVKTLTDSESYILVE